MAEWPVLQPAWNQVQQMLLGAGGKQEALVAEHRRCHASQAPTRAEAVKEEQMQRQGPMQRVPKSTLQICDPWGS